jgi:hypothetical protein
MKGPFSIAMRNNERIFPWFQMIQVIGMAKRYTWPKIYDDRNKILDIVQ